ncbi:MAG: hypothetical protein ACXVIM_05895 [Acidimicrobiia bacterium]
MSDLERNLRDMLNQRAAATPTPPGDWQDLIIRMSRRDRRAKRLMAVGLAVVLILGPIAGFAVARSVDDSGPSGRVTAGAPSGSSRSVQVATADGGVASYTIASEPGLQLEKLFHRTGADDIVIRAFVTKIGGGNMCQGNGWCPPADCFPDGLITGQLNTEAAVGVAHGGHYGAVTSPVKVVGNGVFGANGEGSPARWVIAQASDKAAKVRVTFDGGGSDEMAPVDGVVVLAALTDTAKTGGTIESLDSSGTVLGHADVGIGPAGMTWGNVAILQSGESVTTATTIAPTAVAPPAAGVGPNGTVVTPGSRSECQPPPPSLPTPGVQPQDAAAARAEVIQAFETAYSGTADDTAKAAAVEDSGSLKDVMAKADSGPYAQQVKDASAKVTDVVFTSPTEAAVRYDIDIKNYSSNFTDRIGKALFVDGRWKVAKVTVCADISLAGVTCPTK